ncbi:MAG: alpha/beta fold hydrolase [Pseudomonadota bacterium]
MASRAPFSSWSTPSQAGGELARRLELARESRPEDEHGRPSGLRLAGELDVLLEPVRRPVRKLDIVQSANPKIVMILPGFFTGPMRMRYLAKQIERAGHKTKRWGLGFNFGPTPENIAMLEQRLLEINDRYDCQPVLLGWSLGGLFARELAKRQPEKVAKVITMGSPFSGNPRANNAWRLYQFVTGHRVDQPPVEHEVSGKPPVETVAMWSPRDGVVSPRSSRGMPGERDRAIGIRCTHLGFSYHPKAVQTVLSELERD